MIAIERRSREGVGFRAIGRKRISYDGMDEGHLFSRSCWYDAMFFSLGPFSLLLHILRMRENGRSEKEEQRDV